YKTEKVAIIPFCKSNCHFHSSLFQSGNKLFTSLLFLTFSNAFSWLQNKNSLCTPALFSVY
ncbi:MAG: hypothetical protein KHW38_05660, partial [Dorea sp.]|nr:hypothetical protein [Dorea sp.]